MFIFHVVGNPKSGFITFYFFLIDHSIRHAPQSSSRTKSQDKTEWQVIRQQSTIKSTMAESKSTKLQKNQEMLKDKKRTRPQNDKQVSFTSQSKSVFSPRLFEHKRSSSR